MGSFKKQIENGVALVTLDQGGMNTLSRATIDELSTLERELRIEHARQPLAGVILVGNRFGLGAGANIGELLKGSKADLEALIDRGHEVLFRIEESPFPWLAAIDGVCLGGIYELALACRAIVATRRSSVGLPEMMLNLFPGLGGTQRLPRRCGLVNAADPTRGEAALTVILQGKTLVAEKAAAVNMIDAIVPDGEDVKSFALQFLRETLPKLKPAQPDFSMAEQVVSMVLPTIRKATQGRDHPRAPFVALDVVTRGVRLPLKDAIKLERDHFIELANSSEAKAGMRFFFAQQRASKLPAALAKTTPRPVRKVAVDGFDGYMGNAIAFLARRAGYEVVGHVPVPALAVGAAARLRQKYDFLIERGRMDTVAAERETASVVVATEIEALADCDLIVEARKEDSQVKADFYRRLAAVVGPGTIVSSNSSSMGPAFLGRFFCEGGGQSANLVNLHFFGPAEHPMRALVEVVVMDETPPEVAAAVHGFVRKIGKIPVFLRDGSAGFLVNAALAEYFREAETLYREGTPIETVDRVMRERIFPVGPFELVDQAGVDVAAGMFDVLAQTEAPADMPLLVRLRDRGRFGVKSGGGFYEYEGGTRGALWDELASLAAPRGDRVAGDDEIVERCVKVMWRKTRDLLARKIVASEEEADLAFVHGVGFAMYLGGPLFYAQQQGWS